MLDTGQKKRMLIGVYASEDILESSIIGKFSYQMALRSEKDLLFSYGVVGGSVANKQPSMINRGVQVARSKRRNSYYELWKARREFDRSRVDRRTREGRIAFKAMRRRGRKSAEDQSALAAVGYPGY